MNTGYAIILIVAAAMLVTGAKRKAEGGWRRPWDGR
jgi:hypothetical protein